MSIDFLKKINIEEEIPEDPNAILAANYFYPENSGFLKYSKWLIYALAFLVPLFFLPWTSEILEFNKQFLIIILLGAALVLYLIQIVRTGRIVLKKSAANYEVLIVLAAGLLVSLFSDFRYQSIFGGFDAGFYGSFISLAGFAVLFFLVLNIFGADSASAKKEAHNLLSIFFSSLFLALVLGILNLLGIPVFKLFGISQKYFNTAGNLNSLGILASILLIFSFSKTNFFTGGSYLRYARIPALFLSLFFLLLVNWWVLWLVAIAGLVFTVILNSMRDWRILNYFWPLIVVLLGIISILLNLNLAGFLKVSLPVEISPSFQTSFEINRQVLMKDPLFGVGPENFSFAYDLYKPLSINKTNFWNIKFSESSSELFNTAVSGGITGLAAFIFLIFISFRTGQRDYHLFPILAAFVAAWALYPYNMVLGFGLWLTIGLMALSDHRTSAIAINLEKSPRHSLLASASFISILVLILIGSYFVFLHYVADMKFAKALTAQDIDRRIQLMAEAVNLNKSEDMYSRTLANLIVSRISQEVDNLNKVKTAEERQKAVSKIQNFSAAAVNLGNQTTKTNKTNSANWFSRALVYESLASLIDGSAEQAILAYQEYSKISPKDPEPYLRIGNINLTKADSLRRLGQDKTQGQISENLKLAEESYQKTLELKPNYVLAVYNLGVVYERQGRVKNAIKQLESVKSTNLQDANLAFELGLLYYRDGQKDKSFGEFERAISIFPDFSNARWYLALFLEERSQIDDALNQLYKIQKSNPNNQILRDKIRSLETGKRSLPPQKVTGVKPLE